MNKLGAQSLPGTWIFSCHLPQLREHKSDERPTVNTNEHLRASTNSTGLSLFARFCGLVLLTRNSFVLWEQARFPSFVATRSDLNNRSKRDACECVSALPCPRMAGFPTCATCLAVQVFSFPVAPARHRTCNKCCNTCVAPLDRIRKDCCKSNVEEQRRKTVTRSTLNQSNQNWPPRTRCRKTAFQVSTFKVARACEAAHIPEEVSEGQDPNRRRCSVYPNHTMHWIGVSHHSQSWVRIHVCIPQNHWSSSPANSEKILWNRQATSVCLGIGPHNSSARARS